MSGSKVGRKGQLLELCARASFGYCIAVDVGYTKLAIYDMLFNRVAYREIPVDSGMLFEQIIDAAAELMPELAVEADVPISDIGAVGISSVGSVSNGILKYVAQFNWSDVDAVSYAKQCFSLPVVVENDCKAALIGEQFVHYGIEGPQNIVYITLGRRGVGSAAMVNGELLRGSSNFAGEIGHITVELDGMLCDCGRKGCLQTFLAEQFILVRAAAIDPRLTSIQKIIDAVSEDDERVAILLLQINRYIGVALNIAACAYNPEVIFINDHFLLGSPHSWHKNTETKMPRYIFMPMLEQLQLEPVMLDEDASLYGIYCILQDELLAAKLSSLDLKEN